MRKLHKVRVLENNLTGSYGYLLKFARDFDFTAGQVIGITLDETLEPRLYSIASGTTDKDIGILYTVKPDGLLTPPLATVEKGSSIFITQPFGNFICKEKEAIWIATGTGIAPFASMFFSGQHEGKTLVQGARDQKGLYFSDQFSQVMKSRYVKCTSREEQYGNFSGRVTDYITQLPEIRTDIPYYLCGTAEMVVDTRDLLISRGVAFNNIMAEIFF